MDTIHAVHSPTTPEGQWEQWGQQENFEGNPQYFWSNIVLVNNWYVKGEFIRENRKNILN